MKRLGLVAISISGMEIKPAIRYSWKVILPALSVGDKFTIPYTDIQEASKIKHKLIESISRYNKDGKLYYVNLTFIRKEIVITRDA